LTSIKNKHTELQDKRTELQAEHGQALAELGTSRQTVVSLTGQVDSLDTERSSLASRLAALTDEHKLLTDEHTALQTRFKSATISVETLVDDVSKQKADLSQQVSAVAALKADLSQQVSAVAALEATVLSLRSDLETKESANTGLTKQLQGLGIVQKAQLREFDSLSAKHAALVESEQSCRLEKERAEIALAKAEMSLAQLTQTNANNCEALTQTEAELDTVRTQKVALQSSRDDLEKTVMDQQAALTASHARVAQCDLLLSQLEGERESERTRFSTQLSLEKQRLVATCADLADVKVQLATHEAALVGLTTSHTATCASHEAEISRLMSEHAVANDAHLKREAATQLALTVCAHERDHVAKQLHQLQAEFELAKADYHRRVAALEQKLSRTEQLHEQTSADLESTQSELEALTADLLDSKKALTAAHAECDRLDATIAALEKKTDVAAQKNDGDAAALAVILPTIPNSHPTSP
jgi:chromosome segregation ATPase